jgi:nanoRNase/pAp phosphatase (c-di-AMP/oligoRNAs hydrolase)
MEELKEIVIIYHKNCQDGFAAAWAAWKKFGDSASYIPASYGDELPEGIEGREVYVVDFSYSTDSGRKLPTLESKAKKLVVIDHHKGAETAVQAVKEHVFDLSRSGAYLSWQYFHPGEKMPTFLEYIDEGDRYSFTLPHSDEIGVYVFTRPRTFEAFEALYNEMEDEHGRKKAVEKGQILMEYRETIIQPALESIHFVDLAGTVLPAINVTLPLDEKSYTINKVLRLYPPVALSYRYDEGEWKCSLRSNGDFDCIALASKFGGSGHKVAAGFAIKAEPGVFPFKIVEKE